MTHSAATPRETGSACDLTVCIVAGTRRDRARRAIESVLRQEVQGSFEVIVADLANGIDAPVAVSADRRLRIVRCSPRTTFGEARAAAVALARAPVVAFLEEHCRAHAGWAEALRRAHQGPWACVGAEVHSLNPGTAWSDAVYFVGYSAWMPTASSAEVVATAAHNSSYHKADLLALGDRLPVLLMLEPLLQAELRRLGGRFFLASDARFDHENESRLTSLEGFYVWNRLFGRVRSREWSTGRKMTYTALSGAAPWFRTARGLLRSLRSRRPALLEYLRLLPWILAVHAIATLGLVVGMWAGRPDDDARFTDLELRSNADR